MTPPRHPGSRLADAMTRLLGGEAAAGVLLIVVALAAIAVVNSPLGHGYDALLHGALPWTPIARLPSLHHWINDGLMAVFFFVVGLEIKREALAGELASPARRRLPILAAAAGMAVPAMVYLAIVDTPLQRGWAIPAATDIAFAVGVLALVGRRMPPALRLLLLTVAIVDDLGAVVIIALFYTSALAPGWLLAALAPLAGLFLLNRLGVGRIWPFLLLTAALWCCVLHSGVHATIAGVLAALAIPLRPRAGGDSLLLRLEHALTPWSGYLIVPLFGFANAGVSLAGVGADGLLAPLPLAIAAGLFLGKPAGIFGAILLAHRTGLAEPPHGATWPQLFGLSVLCGIGFTMSLFIGALAFPHAPHLVEEAKLGILAGSLASGLLGYAVLRWAPAR